jgi:hypothetical protein
MKQQPDFNSQFNNFIATVEQKINAQSKQISQGETSAITDKNKTILIFESMAEFFKKIESEGNMTLFRDYLKTSLGLENESDIEQFLSLYPEDFRAALKRVSAA